MAGRDADYRVQLMGQMLVAERARLIEMGYKMCK
jgi:hypothetical protein